MSGECLTLDTNILLQALDADAGDRHRLAGTIVDQAVLLDCRLTLQAVSEFHAVVSRKRLVPAAEAAAQAEDWLTMFRSVAASVGAIRAALTAAARGRASYWGALLVATAAEAGCSIILTEDLADGTVMQGVRIINPFAGDALTTTAAALLPAE